MSATLTTFYPWIKALHIIAVIAWMAGLLYLPRLFVYHAEAGPGTDRAEMLKIMERRLLRAIMNPAMIAVFVFGGLLLATPGIVAGAEGWLHVKLALVVLMAVFHMVMAGWRKAFEADNNTRPARFYRMMNEVPTVLMIAIVVLVVVRPF
jgi:putative membrane protein